MKRLLPALVVLALATPAGAAVFTVTKTADTQDGACGPYDCSLREAVTEANRLSDVDVIELPAGVYTLTRAGMGEDQNASGDLDVHRPLILVGGGAGTTILDGNGTDRVLDLRAQTEIFGVTVRNGGVDGPGGAVLARAAVLDYQALIRRSVISGNHARGPAGDGGGVMGEGQAAVLVFESTLSGNRADGSGGGLAASRFQLINSTVSGNSAGLFGGGLYFPQELSPAISGSTLTANQAGQSGGGIYARQPLFPSSVDPHIRGSIVAGNTAPDHPDCVRALSAGYNVFGAGESCSGHALDREGTEAAPLDPGLGPLVAQGGPTPVHAVLAGSPAIGLLPAGTCEPADQRGLERTGSCEAGAVERPGSPVCIPGGPVLCLQGGRFRVTASWSGGGTGGPATAAPLTDDTGNYWFFSPQNLELTVKVLDGCEVNDRFWVFTSGLTDRGVDLQVEDLASGQVWTHAQPAGTTYAPRLDTSALGCTILADTADSGTVRETAGLLSTSAVLVVTRRIDALDGACDHDCSLREAVSWSNARPGIEVIVLGRGVYTLSRPGRHEDGNATGDLDATGHLVILGAGAGSTVIDGGGHDRVLEADTVNSSLEIHGVTIRNGRTGILDNRDSGAGAGVNGGVLTLVGCHVTGNSSASHGGGFAGFAVTARDTTVSGNQAQLGGGVGFADTLRLANVTVSGNQASLGGGIVVDAYDQELTHVTIAGNRADQGGGLAFSQATCPSDFCRTDFSMVRSLVAGNTAAEGPDCYGMEQEGYNVYGIDDGGCGHGPTDVAGTVESPLDPGITPLGDHGGSTPTHALLAGSPAIDLAPLDGCPARDQRGRTRPSGPGCDAGAVELHPGCQPDGTTLCLGEGDRFRVTSRWTARGSSGEQSGDAHSIPLATDTGSFWFFNPANVELTLKVLDGCGVNDRFWVFASGLTDVRVDITVEDIVTGRTWTHRNNPGAAFQPRLDTGAFVCP